MKFIADEIYFIPWAGVLEKECSKVSNVLISKTFGAWILNDSYIL